MLTGLAKIHPSTTVIHNSTYAHLYASLASLTGRTLQEPSKSETTLSTRTTPYLATTYDDHPHTHPTLSPQLPWLATTYDEYPPTPQPTLKQQFVQAGNHSRRNPLKHTPAQQYSTTSSKHAATPDRHPETHPSAPTTKLVSLCDRT